MHTFGGLATQRLGKCSETNWQIWGQLANDKLSFVSPPCLPDKEPRKSQGNGVPEIGKLRILKSGSVGSVRTIKASGVSVITSQFSPQVTFDLTFCN